MLFSLIAKSNVGLTILVSYKDSYFTFTNHHQSENAQQLTTDLEEELRSNKQEIENLRKKLEATEKSKRKEEDFIELQNKVGYLPLFTYLNNHLASTGVTFF